MALREQNAAHQDVAFDVFGIFLQYFFGESFGLADGRGRLLAAHQVIVSEPHANFEVVRIQIDDLLHLIECLLISLKAFVSVRQSPVRVGESLVDLQGATKLQACFLKLLVFQEGLATSDMLGFGFFRCGARGRKKGSGNYDEQRKDVELSALSIFHYCGSPVS